uniref:Dynamin N-terminal domain-containing protein n=1 Tax=Chromera velia CCMP2878 TaxID=1169474 RepID=A0A0G4HNL5_9ALVE|eukprot:Cvel_29485.t1-p1 / transcript=Cvel_29485.t1 / gene=Cvel_29485 / organism=Chromera_velia_CCMP2878 / gene_product=Interferon-induced GTP-binding protein Mx, putative / transcript_product=Interferon-induced GTP-binding protein Mx, putative / location=Cvel_scaffold4046:7549-8580(-) / protein_length=344 / sequence_SO=supercontig / SO=protein_coding / is_pseudo=false
MSAAQLQRCREYQALQDELHNFETGVGEVKFPRVLVMGTQSAGKTSMVEFLSGMRIGYSAVDTATRCPVHYKNHYIAEATTRIHIQNVLQRNLDADLGTLRSIQPSEIHLNSTAQVAQALHVHMKITEKVSPSGFSTDEVVVEIWSNLSNDVSFVDLPGLITAPRNDREIEAAKAIQLLNAKVCRSKWDVIVAVIKCTESPETLSDRDHVARVFEDPELAVEERPYPGWKRACPMVVNKTDTLKHHITTVQDANTFFAHARRRGDFSYMFCTLNPGGQLFHGNDGRPLPAQQANEKLRNLQQIERQCYDEWIRGLIVEQPGQVFNEQNWEMLGVEHVLPAILHR